MVRFMSCLLTCVAPLVMLTFAASAFATPLFDDSAVIEIELTGPISSVIANKSSRDELPFVLRANGVEHDVYLRTRGKSRMRVCDFPPLRIGFSGNDTADSVFAGQTQLKLVTQCQKHKSSTSNLLEEFTAYRIFNLISDISYKVRLLRVRYTDTDADLRPEMVEQYGFFIESKAGLAERTRLEPATLIGVKRSSFNQQQVAEVYVFQYLIGNTDWSLVMADGDDECCHNGELFKSESDLFYVPYDFDLAGLVNARYAKPDPELGIRSVTQRRYRGYCVSTEVLISAIRRIKALRSDILQVPGEIPGRSAKDVAANIQYLERFFDEAENEEKLIKSFEKRCL